VPPTQSEDFAASQACQEHRQEDDARLLDPRVFVVRYRTSELRERLLDPPHFGRREDRPAPAWLPRTLDEGDRIRGASPRLSAVLKIADRTFRWRLIVRGSRPAFRFFAT
jgi:hypothetical protein